MNKMLQATENKFTTTRPFWLQEGLRGELMSRGHIEYATGFTDAERKVYRKRRRIPPSKWCEKHRVVTMTSLPGLWRNSVTPYLAGIMDASFFPSVQTTIICKAPQTGGSEAIHNCIGYAIDRSPGPVLYIYPDELTARENSNDRIQPMIENSPRLHGYMTGQGDDFATLRINLQHMPIYLGWARSPSRLANKPIRYLIFDETDKYPDTAGKREADPLSLGEKRTITYRWSRKLWKLSTPTIEAGHIWQAFTFEAQVCFDYWVHCPYCRTAQLMEFKHIKWPEDERDPESIVNHSLAWYECPHCRQKWDDEKRNQAVRAGHWQDRETGTRLRPYLEQYRPIKIAFHIPSWLSFFVSLSEIAAAFLKATRSKTKLKDFKNNHEAVPWLEYEVERSEDRILALRDERPAGLVPGAGRVAALTAAADTHADGFIYEVRAWGWGLEEESWGVRHGKVLSLNALERIFCHDAYLDPEGNQYIINLAVIDAFGLGDDHKHSTTNIYKWCQKHPGLVLPLKGEQRMNQAFAFTKLDSYPGKKQPIPGNLYLLRINSTFFKSELAGRLDVAPADPGAWHLNSEYDQEWARQMTAEYIDPKTGYWVCPDSKANHGWDVSHYNLAAAYVRGIRFWKKPEQIEASSPKNKPQQQIKRW